MKTKPRGKSGSARSSRIKGGKASPRKTEITDRWKLRLYVAGQSAKSLAAFANLKRLCDEHLASRYHIEVIDLLKHPQLAQGDQIVAVPTLVRYLPPPMKRVIGDLSDQLRVMVGMDLRPMPDPGTPKRQP